MFFETWMSRIPLPLTAADRDHGCWWQLAMRQMEVSRTLVFDDPGGSGPCSRSCWPAT